MWLLKRVEIQHQVSYTCTSIHMVMMKNLLLVSNPDLYMKNTSKYYKLQTQTQSKIDQSLAFYQAAGGEKKRIYGLGSRAKYFFGPNLHASSGSNASSSAAPPNAQSAPMANLDELVMRLIPALTDHMVPVLIDNMLLVLAERVRGLIASPSHVQDNHTDHPSAMAPLVPPPPTTNINEVHASLSDDDLHSPVSL